jgi:hypothetical protein
MGLRHRISLLLALPLVIGLCGCNTWQTRAEFAPPQSRWPSTMTSTSGAEDPPPPIPAQYCYRTLASVDCFSEAKPERLSGYNGVYPNPDSMAPKR